LKRIGTGWLLPGSGLAAVTGLCPCGGARGRVQNEWESMGFHPKKIHVSQDVIFCQVI